jgi:hypothetical protein
VQKELASAWFFTGSRRGIQGLGELLGEGGWVNLCTCNRGDNLHVTVFSLSAHFKLQDTLVCARQHRFNGDGTTKGGGEVAGGKGDPVDLRMEVGQVGAKE